MQAVAFCSSGEAVRFAAVLVVAGELVPLIEIGVEAFGGQLEGIGIVGKRTGTGDCGLPPETVVGKAEVGGVGILIIHGLEFPGGGVIMVGGIESTLACPGAHLQAVGQEAPVRVSL